uniref:ABC transporter domain-containing protein n=1 Tax=Euplotes harpa TaxID=151035 RepID=A0A7S3J1J8_9SPIT|mmetsp:Transcript_12077/g.13746  ORF Transcript_12077/g.13746 Transcript_12077/m.13746 type:complete len:688 (+) Transcript_12077:40-2103(+)
MDTTIANSALEFIKMFFKTRTRSTVTCAVVVAATFYFKNRMQKTDAHLAELEKEANMFIKAKDVKAKGHVDMKFWKRLKKLIKIAIPSLKSREVGYILFLSIMLVVRTILSIQLAEVNGGVVYGIIKMDKKKFISGLMTILAYSIPSSIINSLLEYLMVIIALCFRENLTRYYHDKYINDKMFYQICNLDDRILNPDQRLTVDIQKWAISLSNLYSNFSKPLLDIILFSKKLGALVGVEGVLLPFGWYAFSGIVLRYISPAFGTLTAVRQKLEGEYRGQHFDILSHSEEIAFYNGGPWEIRRISTTFQKLYGHIVDIIKKQFWMGIFESMLVKYGSYYGGYLVLGMPVFGRKSDAYMADTKGDTSKITGDYVRNTSLLINLSKAIGKFILSYKELQDLAGYTSLMDELDVVLEDLRQGKYQRTLINPDLVKERGRYIADEAILKMEKVPILAPNGDILIKEVNFEIRKGMHLMVDGPNGCGKSSVFRIMGELWPLFAGVITKPNNEAAIFYVPQIPYLPKGSLRDQIIYPDQKLQMIKKKMNDNKLRELLKILKLDYIVEREGGLNTVRNWTDVLSGGEKQRMAIARLYYHRPTFAILDECSSAVSVDAEDIIYNEAKRRGITIITVSHRPSLWKHHDYLLQFDGEGGYSFGKIELSKKNNAEYDKMVETHRGFMTGNQNAKADEED